ncbi:MAG TPA: DUF1616 domain-containing protein, partial [Methanotrichaceae archaeon]|nr:DUF1616 domain-containing protein [Methanotrichaceae archaeon]
MPGDLLGAAMLAILTLAFTLLPPLEGLPVRIPLGLAVVLFLPGYALIAALFPRRDDLGSVERVALSFGLSISVVPLIGLGLNYTPWGIRLVPVVISLAIFTIVMATAAYIRRSMQAPEERFSTNLKKSLVKLKDETLASSSGRLDKALTVILIITILLSISALAYVIVIPKQGEKFTEFYILGPGGKAYDYPTKVGPGNNSTVIVGVVNHEYVLTNYTMRLAFRNETLLSRDIRLAHNQTWEQPVSYILNDPGHDNELEFMLYRESNLTAPYRELHLWINTIERNGSASTVPSVSLIETPQHVFMGYANIEPAVFNASKIRHSHGRGREVVNVTNVTLLPGNLTEANVTMPGQNLSNDTGLKPFSGRDEISLSRLMNLSRNASKSYPKINATLIGPKSSQPHEVSAGVISIEAQHNQFGDAGQYNSDLEPQLSQSQELPDNAASQLNPSQENPANVNTIEPQINQS